jgi:hypothetical protein
VATVFEDIKFQWRHGTTAEWVAANPVLRNGEPGAESDTHKAKVGDGIQTWLQLPYLVTDVSVAAQITTAIADTPSIGQADLDAVTGMVLTELELPDLVLLWENAKA